MNENIHKEIGEINQKIFDLEGRRNSLYRILRGDAKTFKEKLKIWADTEDYVSVDWAPDDDEYPKLAKYLEEKDLNRHKKYDLVEYFDRVIGDYLEKDIELEPKIREILEEAVEKNLRVFTFDW